MEAEVKFYRGSQEQLRGGVCACYGEKKNDTLEKLVFDTGFKGGVEF